jgi:signal transduction histidine kinase
MRLAAVVLPRRRAQYQMPDSRGAGAAGGLTEAGGEGNSAFPAAGDGRKLALGTDGARGGIRKAQEAACRGCPEMLTESIADQVLLDRVRAIFQQMLVPVLTTFVNAVIAATVLQPFTSKPELLAVWLVLFAALTATRLLCWRRFRGERPSPKDASKWARVAAAGALASGTLWGFGGSVLVPRMDMPELFLAFLTSGMCAGAASIYAAHMPTLLSFILPASLPVALSFAIQDSPISLAMGALILVFAAALAFAGQRFSGYFGAMSESRVRLAERTRELDSVDARLRAEIAERETTEAMLRQAQKMQAIGRLTTGIAHDFGNILGLISGTVELLQRQTQEAPDRAGLLANCPRLSSRERP